MEAVRKLYTK